MHLGGCNDLLQDVADGNFAALLDFEKIEHKLDVLMWSGVQLRASLQIKNSGLKTQYKKIILIPYLLFPIIWYNADLMRLSLILKKWQ